MNILNSVSNWHAVVYVFALWVFIFSMLGSKSVSTKVSNSLSPWVQASAVVNSAKNLSSRILSLCSNVVWDVANMFTHSNIGPFGVVDIHVATLIIVDLCPPLGPLSAWHRLRSTVWRIGCAGTPVWLLRHAELTFYIGSMPNMGVSINGGIPIYGWFRENVSVNGWFGGTPISGTPHIS